MRGVEFIMGLMGSVWKDLKKLARPYDEEDEFFEYQQGITDKLPLAPKTPAQARSSYANIDDQHSNKLVNIHTTAQLKVALFVPERFDAVTGIADNLRDRNTVVLNLEKVNSDTARRIADFLSGVAYAQEGNIKKVSVNTYLITPYNVDLLGDLMDELENNGLYF